MRYLLSFILLCSISSIFGQTSIAKQLDQYRKDYLPEKVFLHTDKNIYAAGETIWMTLYLADGQTHRPGAFSVFARVELLDTNKELVKSLKVFAPKGHASATIDLSGELAAGDYQLLAYTNYQRNSGETTIFRKTIRIVKGLKKETLASTKMERGSTDSEIKLRFFPEGGDCITGLPCKMAMVAENASNTPMLAEGQIKSKAGETLAFFKTGKEGMGQFTFTPKTNETYQAVLKSGARFDLPRSLREGYTLNVRQMKTAMQLAIQTNLGKGLRDAHLLIHQRGAFFFEKVLDLSEKATVINIPKSDLTPGIFVVTLFNAQKQAVAERLFFVAPDMEEMQIKMNLDAQEISLRQEVNLSLQAPSNKVFVDSLGIADLSLSIIPSASSTGVVENNICAWFLLNSDIDQYIPNAAALLFSEKTKARDYLIDQFLMTRGWRRFRWETILNKKNFKPSFELERGLFLEGRMTKIDNDRQARPGKVFLTQMEDNIFEESLTDEEGYFSFGPYLLFDTTNFIVQGRFRTGKKNRDKINIEDNAGVMLTLKERHQSPEIPMPIWQQDKAAQVAQSYEELSQKMLITARNYDSLTVELDAVSITAERISEADKERNERAYLYGEPSFRMVIDSTTGASTATTMRQLFFRVPGIQVTGNSIQIRGPSSFLSGTAPTYIVNGSQVTEDFVFNAIMPQDVEFIDVLKGAEASIYGVRGANGIILIYTRKGGMSRDRNRGLGIINASVFGFHKSREFAVFDPNVLGNQNRPDLRTTIHWNPHLITDETGRTKVSFTTSDQLGTFLVVAQGLRRDGKPLFGMTTYQVEN
ncbi:MAG: TonB-dependent receptor plug domain-containing protein [Bacteroidota bacterium]